MKQALLPIFRFRNGILFAIKSQNKEKKMNKTTKPETSISRRLSIIHYVKSRGIKPAVRTFKISVPTIKKWLCRYKEYGISGLANNPKIPDIYRHKIDKF